MEILRGTSDGDGGYIEVRPGGVNKGAFVSAILSRQVSRALCIVTLLLRYYDSLRYAVVADDGLWGVSA